jgi:hypothetical protein
MRDPKAFFDVVRSKFGPLTTSQVMGFNLFIAEAERRKTYINYLSSLLGQVWWETGKTMAPVAEAYYLGAKADAVRRKMRYYPFYGRGHIQTTWETNYRKSSQIWKEMTGEDVDFVKNPDLLLQNKYSVPLTFEGFERGFWTGKAQDDFIDLIDESDDEDLREFANARRIVNGLDRAAELGQFALTFEKALKAGGYGYSGEPEKPVVLDTPKPLPPLDIPAMDPLTGAEVIDPKPLPTNAPWWQHLLRAFGLF